MQIAPGYSDICEFESARPCPTGVTNSLREGVAYCCCGTRTGGIFATALSICSAESNGLIVTRAYPAAFVLNCAVAAAISSGVKRTLSR
jgi:hypothetical protein